MRRLIVALFVFIIVGGVGLFFWGRSVLTQDNVRTALAEQLSEALGQPVSVGRISATIYPRVIVTLGSVTIGDPARINVSSLDVGTDFRALLSRRIEHASAKADGVRIELPLPPLGNPSSASSGARPPGGATAPPVELVSIDEIALSNVEVVSAGRSLRGDVEVVPESSGGFTLRRLSLTADDARIEATGRITDLTGPIGEMTIKAGELNLDRLLAFLSDFAGSAARTASSSSTAAATAAKPNLTVEIGATRATLAGMALDTLSARAHVTENGLSLEPFAFGSFGGKYNGALAFQVAASGAPRFALKGSVVDIDLPAVTRFAGSQSEPLTGRLSAQLDLSGTGTEIAAALRATRGTARVTIQNGIVRNLGLVRAIVVATSMRGTSSTLLGAGAAARQEVSTSRDEPFKTIRTTLAVAAQNAATNDLQFEGTNVSLLASGSIALNGSDVDLTGRVQLSDELTAQAGTDLVRVTRENGRVTLPVTVTGPAEAMTVRIDVGQVVKRAIQNRAEDEIKKALTKGLGGLFKKPPK